MKKLELPFTIESFKSLLKGAAIGKKQPTHEQIANWAEQFFLEYEQGNLEYQNNPSIDKAIDIAYEIETEWSMFLMSRKTSKEHEVWDHSKLYMPKEWFEEWLQKLEKEV